VKELGAGAEAAARAGGVICVREARVSACAAPFATLCLASPRDFEAARRGAQQSARDMRGVLRYFAAQRMLFAMLLFRYAHTIILLLRVFAMLDMPYA